MMKTLMLISALVAVSFLSSCDELNLCDGNGTLSVTNKSDNTLQQLMIDGVNYGTLDPGENKDVDLAAGQHFWQLVGIDGGGCNEAYVIIVECKTVSFSCDGK